MLGPHRCLDPVGVVGRKGPRRLGGGGAGTGPGPHLAALPCQKRRSSMPRRVIGSACSSYSARIARQYPVARSSPSTDIIPESIRLRNTHPGGSLNERTTLADGPTGENSRRIPSAASSGVIVNGCGPRSISNVPDHHSNSSSEVSPVTASMAPAPTRARRSRRWPCLGNSCGRRRRRSGWRPAGSAWHALRLQANVTRM